MNKNRLTKLLAQGLLAVIVTAYFLLNPATEVQARELFIPFSKTPLILNLGLCTVIFYAVVIMGSSNAVNLTDGLDGLAAGCTCTSALTYAVLAYVAGNFKIATYLDIPFYPLAGELAVVCMAMVGASFGFLWFNCHPAEVFMGDTGSLAIGGVLGLMAVLIHQPFVLFIAGGVFVAEALSVMLQVGWFKITKRKYGTGRRIFLMSPLHHHFRKKGLAESKIVTRFYIAGILCAVVALSTLKVR